MVNVLFLAVDVDLRRFRGDSVHVRELALHLKDLGHSVAIVSATSGDYRLPGVGQIERGTSFGRQVTALARTAGRWADVVYERRLSPKLAWSIGLLADVPFVVEVNGVLDEERAAQGHEVALGEAVRRRLRGVILRDAFRVVAVSRGIREHLLSDYAIAGDRAIVVQNGANTEVFHPMDKAVCQSQLGIPSGSKVLCFVGNLVAWQGVDKMLRALVPLSRSEPSILALVVGDGPELERLKALASHLGISTHVRFLGVIPYSEIPQYICAADVCVAPFVESRKTSPIKIFEYLACARPVVATDVDEIGDFLRKCQGGLLVDPKSDASFVESISALLRSPSDNERMGTSGRKVVLAEHSWKSTAAKVAQILEDAVVSGRRGRLKNGRRISDGTLFEA